MSDDSDLSQLLKAVVSLLGRSQFAEEELRKRVVPARSQAQYIEAYNLCDGTRTRADVAKAVSLDKDNFNKVVNRWLEQGVLFELGPARSPRLLHLYHLTEQVGATVGQPGPGGAKERQDDTA